MVFYDSDHSILEREKDGENALPLSKHESDLEVLKVWEDFTCPGVLSILHGAFNKECTDSLESDPSNVHFSVILLSDVLAQNESLLPV